MEPVSSFLSRRFGKGCWLCTGFRITIDSFPTALTASTEEPGGKFFGNANKLRLTDERDALVCSSADGGPGLPGVFFLAHASRWLLISASGWRLS
jgi:hypothetical protein